MTWQAEVRAVFGAAVTRGTRCHGGDLSDVFRADLADGRRLAVKIGTQVGRESRMLQAMRAAGAPVPEVLHEGADLLCLAWLEEAPPSAAGWEALGDGLRRLHDCPGSAYGWPEDYAFGAVRIANAATDDWPRFWAERRLLPFPPTLPRDLARRVESLAERLPEHLPRSPAPALLHGDLWTGNALFTAQAAYLIDPACYHGHAEVDLAMLELFGRPDTAFWQGYGASAADRSERIAIYQLWPALIHLRLFGAGYGGMVAALLDRSGV